MANPKIKFKPALTLEQQVEHLKLNKNIVFSEIVEKTAKQLLLRYNYINLITPFKHYFAEKDLTQSGYLAIRKVNGNHVYQDVVDFKEYYDLYKNERAAYPKIFSNIIIFETSFKSILTYKVMNYYKIKSLNGFRKFVVLLETRIKTSKYVKPSQINNLIMKIHDLENDLIKSANIYNFFDRLSLKSILTIYRGLNYYLQQEIVKELIKLNLTFGITDVNSFIEMAFMMVAIRNCVCHCNSMEILLRFYDYRSGVLRSNTDSKEHLNLIKKLSI